MSLHPQVEGDSDARKAYSKRQQMRLHAPDVLEHPFPLAPGLHVPLEPLQTKSKHCMHNMCMSQRAATSHCCRGTAATDRQASKGCMHSKRLSPFVCCLAKNLCQSRTATGTWLMPLMLWVPQCQDFDEAVAGQRCLLDRHHDLQDVLWAPHFQQWCLELAYIL